MDFAELEIFRTVAQQGGVTRAAQSLRRVQSNVTTRLRQLEAELGVELFLRQGRRMTLTPDGERFLVYAERLLSLAEEARQALRPQRPSGRFRIGTMESTAASRLPLPLARFHKDWPEVRLELSTAPTATLVERVLSHQLDCALVAEPAAEEALDAALERHPVFTEELHLVLPAEHPAVTQAADLRVATLAAFESGCSYRRLAENWIASSDPAPAPWPQILELGSYHAILACVAAGAAFGVAPLSVLALQPLPAAVRTQPLRRVETLLIRRRGYRSAAFDAFRQVLARR